jgi:hypothetical protein
MTRFAISAAVAAMMLATAANAQQQPAKPAPAPAAKQQPQGAPTIHSVNIVDIQELPKETQEKVNIAVAKRSEAGLAKLRSSIDAAPQIKSALEAKGLTSMQVIAASLSNDGALTLITKKPG